MTGFKHQTGLTRNGTFRVYHADDAGAPEAHYLVIEHEGFEGPWFFEPVNNEDGIYSPGYATFDQAMAEAEAWADQLLIEGGEGDQS